MPDKRGRGSRISIGKKGMQIPGYVPKYWADGYMTV